MSTVAQLIAKWRGMLDDEVEDYGWSNNVLMGHLNDLMAELCQEIPTLIEDATTASVCQLAVIAGSGSLTLSPLVLRVVRARLSSQTEPLAIRSAKWMDGYASSWESDTDQDTPTILINEGVGTGKVRLYPPSNATDTLFMTVYRLPLADLTWPADQATVPEIPARFHGRLMNGILMRAYGKQDTDTYDEKKYRAHAAAWEEDKEQIKRAMLMERRRLEVNSLPKGLR